MVRTRSCLASCSGVRPSGSPAEGCATSARNDGAKRAISAVQLPSSDAGATSRLGPCALSPAQPPRQCCALWAPPVAGKAGSSRLRRRASRKASTCTVLPRPMSSARQAPRPRRAAKESQRAPTSWYGRSPVRSSSPGSAPASASGLRRPESAWASHGPAWTCDHSATEPSSGAGASAAPSVPARRRMASSSVKEPSCAARCACFQCASTWSSFSRSISTQRPRTSASPCCCARNACHSASLSGSPSRARRKSKSTSASSPSAEGGLSPTVTSTPTRGRFFHQSGMRTTTPAVSSRGVSRKKRSASAGVQERVRKTSPLSTNSLVNSLCAAARWTGRSSLSSAALSPWKSRRAWPSGRCCGRASRESRVV